MNGVVVKTVEELSSVSKSRSHPSISIQGELANNLLISGILRVKRDLAAAEGQVVRLKDPKSPMYSVCEILRELSYSSLFQVCRENSQCQIKICPKPFGRREGN